MTKSQLRLTYKEKRQSLSPEQVEEKSIAIANQVLKLPIWNQTYFHLFLSISQQNEVDTDILMHVLQGKDKQIVVSQSDFNSFSIKNILLTDSTRFMNNKFGIPEPEEGLEVPTDKIDVVFVPLLAFDKTGHRVGYGKGFYDRFLNDCRQDTIKIGLSFFKALNESMEVEEYDVPLDFVVTPEKIYKF
jgi:5-formyltetrahydrofolate cyclo-ligase